MGSHAISLKIGSDIHENLVDRIDMDILRSDISQIDVIDFGTVINIMSHSRGRHQIIDGKLRMFLKYSLRKTLPLPSPASVDILDFLNHFKQSGASARTIRLQGRRNGKAYRLFRTRRIGNDKTCVKRIQSPLDTLHRSIKTLQVDRYILPSHVRLTHFRILIPTLSL